VTEFPEFFFNAGASTYLEPTSGKWHVVLAYPSQQDWQIGADEWHCTRFNAQPPTQGELTQ